MIASSCSGVRKGVSSPVYPLVDLKALPSQAASEYQGSVARYTSHPRPTLKWVAHCRTRWHHQAWTAWHKALVGGVPSEAEALSLEEPGS